LVATCYQRPINRVMRCGHIIQKVSRAFPGPLLGLGRTTRAFLCERRISKPTFQTARQVDNLDELILEALATRLDAKSCHLKGIVGTKNATRFLLACRPASITVVDARHLQS